MPDVVPSPKAIPRRDIGEADRPIVGEDDDPLVGEFAALREAVAEQVRAVARLEVALGQMRGEVARKTGPELFKESLAVIRQDVAGLGERLVRQEAALTAVPSAAAIGAAVQEGVAGLTANVAAMRDAASSSAMSARTAVLEARTRLQESEEVVAALVGRARTQGEQRQWVWTAAAVGTVVGLLLWYPLVAVLPWGGGSWLAATLIGGGRWSAGAELMHEASPVVYDDMVRLYRACGEQATALCEATLAVRAAQAAGGATGGAGQLAAGPGAAGSEGARVGRGATPAPHGRAGR